MNEKELKNMEKYIFSKALPTRDTYTGETLRLLDAIKAGKILIQAVRESDEEIRRLQGLADDRTMYCKGMHEAEKMCKTLADQVDSAESKITERDELLKLFTSQPQYLLIWDKVAEEWLCPWCGKHIDETELESHHPDCPWLKAKQLVEDYEK